MKEGFSMSIDFSCPISGEQRDNNTVRFVAGFVFVITGVALLVAILVSTQTSAIITGFLTLDFFIRAFTKPKYSPLATLARGITSLLKLPKKMVDNAPKVFAARIGVIFSVVSTVLYAGDHLYGGSIVLVILLICAGLESFFSFCLGCWMYSLFPKKLGNVVSRSFVK
jgi:hypothetical protein